MSFDLTLMCLWEDIFLTGDPVSSNSFKTTLVGNIFRLSMELLKFITEIALVGCLL